MIRIPHPWRIALAMILLLGIGLSACVTETVEVTRIKIMERRVIERVIVTVEVTRIQRVIATPRPSPADIGPEAQTKTPEPSPGTATASPTPTRPSATPGTPRPTVPSANRLGESLLAALQNAEQILLPLVGALNSDPLPVDQTVELYNSLRGVPTVSVPEEEAELASIHSRYREQIDITLTQGSDLYNHLVQIQAGQANQTQVSPIHLALARDTASTATSTVQALLRELEALLAALP
jgi:hypothetical protein